MGFTVATSTDGNVSCGVLLWRFRQRLELTVIVKATFAMVPDGGASPATGATANPGASTASLTAPGEIATEDRSFERHPSRSIEIASDLAPYLARCDVLFTGHAHALGGRPTPAGSVRVGLARDARLLLDKTLHVLGDRSAEGAMPEPFLRMPIVYERAIGGPGETNPVGTETPNLVDTRDPRKPAGFGPISRFWPQRKRLLGTMDRRVLDAAVVELPDPTPWEYFQSAPPDQQIDYLRGGEWLVLDGLHAAHARVQTQIPAARGAAFVVSSHPGAPPASTRVELTCDTLAIDGDRQLFSLVWRGHVPIAGGEAALPSVRILAGLEVPGGPVDWALLAAQAPPSARAPIAPIAPAAPAAGASAAGEGTVAVSSDEVARGPVVPFAPTSASTASPASTAATPWAQGPLRAAPPTGHLDVRTPEAGAGEGTLALRPVDQARAGERPITPFAPSSDEGSGHAPYSARGASPPIPGALWSGTSAPAAPAPQAGESTMALSSARLLPGLALAEAMVAPAPARVAPGEARVAPAEARIAPAEARIAPAPANLAPHAAIAPPTSPAVAALPKPAPPKASPASNDPGALASKLRTAGASDDDITALLRALRPPPPPPPDEE